MPAADPPPTPVTILTGFLGSGKTTLILNLLPQLPQGYKLALLKNEFGDVAIDSQLAGESSISGVRELLNGCICCNLVGQVGDALATLRAGGVAPAEDRAGGAPPNRIVIETSGSAFPATLAMEVNRVAAETGHFTLDSVVSVVDVENWAGYEDTSVTARMQARYTDLVVLNKWEEVGERRFDEVLDRLGDLEVDPPVPWVRSNKGRVERDVILGVDGALARALGESGQNGDHEHGHDHEHGDHARDSHQSEVEVLSATLRSPKGSVGTVDLPKLEELLRAAPKDEVYRIKAILRIRPIPKCSDGESAIGSSSEHTDDPSDYILNWAFGRWTFTRIAKDSQDAKDRETLLRMTIITARYESTKWKTRIENDKLLSIDGASDGATLQLDRVT